jgi:hypothetical protein
VKKLRLTLIVVMTLLALGTALVYIQQPSTPPTFAPTPKPSLTPKPEPLNIEVSVTPWGSMYRKEPDCKEDFSVELVYPKQNETFTTDTFNVTFNAGAFFWVVQKAYYTSDLFSGERWINTLGSPQQYSLDLQKTFTFNLTNVPDGNHYLTLTVIFHEGTRNNATALFNVST